MEENQRRKAFYEQLGLPAPAIEQLERMKKTFDTKQMQESIERLTAASTAKEAYLQLREKLQEDEDGWKMLLCQLEAVELCRENYRKTGNRRGNFCGHHALLFPIHSGMLRDERQVCL